LFFAGQPNYEAG